ncbi:putative methyltransferase-domain-containing protein [Jackrogersella minutella]|nr:putative methyltransferase-domain-containing protein [Jackrogersella minutella]
MSPAGHPLSPTSSLPPLLSFATLNGEMLFSALDNLHETYFPVSLSRAVKSQLELGKAHDNAPVEPVDSGYASEDDSGDDTDFECALDTLRADVFERNFAIRWLTTLIARADELLLSDDEQERVVDKASYLLASFSRLADEDDEDDTGITRNFSFELDLSPISSSRVTIGICLTDASQTTTDHTDVGLHSWGAAFVLSSLIALQPARFGFTQAILGSSPRVIELGAGTGVVSLMLAKALPLLGIAGASLIATDYHPAVLANLESNVKLTQANVKTCFLDWSAPVLEAPLDAPADMLIASDVVYAIDHARWLRGCATHLLAPGGVFWLLMTVRPNGRFEAVINTVEAAFKEPFPKAPDGRYLKILSIDIIEKRNGIGRGDESGYKLFRIGWA